MSASAAQHLRDAQAKLSDMIGAEAASRDARLLLMHAAGWSGAQLISGLHEPLPIEVQRQFEGLIEKRRSGLSVAHIIGEVEFYGRVFHVGQGDLAPRPDTETLIDLALSAPYENVLDLGTGTGVIALTLLAERPSAQATATDLQDSYLERARRNAARHELQDRVRFQASDWFADVTGTYDLITSNPPYVSEADYAGLARDILIGERREALTPGGDGLDPYRIIATELARFLRPDGRILVEIGHDQGPAVSELFSSCGLAQVTIHGDINGIDRVVSGKRLT